VRNAPGNGIGQSAITSHTLNFDGIDALRQPVQRSADIEITQLEAGTLKGSLTYLNVGELGVSVGQFSKGLRSRGVFSKQYVKIGLLVAAQADVSHWSMSQSAGGIAVFPPGEDHEGIYRRGASYVAVSLDPATLDKFFGGEPLLDQEILTRQRCLVAPRNESRLAVGKLMATVQVLTALDVAATKQAADFWSRCVVEGFGAILLNAFDQEGDDSAALPSTRVVRQVEDFVAACGNRPVHISEICHKLRMSRRTLHRAFLDSLGIGPVTYLRRKRLSAINSVLSRSRPSDVNVTKVALEHGFTDLGRFAQYYRALLGEYPSETLRRNTNRLRAAQTT
jgi:AraC family ethanolamine operon transcriptional activator